LEEEYIWQLDAKEEIDEEKFRDLIGELDLERAMSGDDAGDYAGRGG
jgi:hypothetical protein